MNTVVRYRPVPIEVAWWAPRSGLYVAVKNFFIYRIRKWPNVVVDLLTLLLLILKIPGLNFDLKTGYPDRGFRCFPQSLQRIPGQ
jgi:hypothetical protein